MNDEKELKALLNEVLANQAVIYQALYKLQNPNKSTPSAWVLEELREKAKEFKS